MNKKSIIRVTSINLFFSIITACSSVSFNPIQKEINNDIKKLNLNSNENITVLDVGNGKLGASFSVKLNFKSGFKLKNNASSTFDGTPSTVKSFKVYLIDGAASLGASGSDITSSILGNSFSVIKTGSSTTSLILSNVNTGSYYVAVGAYQDTGATLNVTQTATNVYIISGGNFALSTTGGDSATGGILSTGGIITVDSSFQINATALSNQMGIPLNLTDAIGATIDTTVNVTNGVYSGSVGGPT
ncbi:MAG: hypothetical protein AABZ74_14870 [Cyanobacteriota bacterium]